MPATSFLDRVRKRQRGRRLRFECLESRQLLAAMTFSPGDDTSTEAGAGAGDPPPPDAQPLPPRQMERLDRGIVAVRRANSQVYVGWRLLGNDPTDVAFNLYRSAGGGAAVKLNGAPLTETTDFVDTTFLSSFVNEYFVRPVIDGVEQDPSESYTLAAFAPVQQFLSIPLNRPAGGQTPDGVNYTYRANDASVGDVDGDGQYEIILKWDPTNSKDNSQSGYTGNVYVDAYNLDGQQLWRIDLGRNIRAGAHYSPFLVYDFDGDGKAEVVMRTAEGTVDGEGTVIGSTRADYRNSSGYVLSGPEYLTVFNGETGAIMDSIDFMPERGSVASWGDTYGNRVDRFQATPAYLDGERPSMVWGRGYAGPQSGLNARNEVAAYDYRDGELSLRWLFEAATNGVNPDYVSQSAHSITVGDVDGDGRDEVITGSAALDDDGTLLYNTELGHGDALHMSDMDPNRPGLEVWMVHESASQYGGANGAGGEFRDAATGELLFGVGATNDVGRGVALDIDPNYPGYEMWGTFSGAGPRMIYSSQGQAIYSMPSNMHVNFGIWWDADLLRETLDGTTISDWRYDWATPGRQNIIFAPANVTGNNGSKNTPSLSADIFGDWREEVIWRRSDNTGLQIWTTTVPAENRLVTLMHDSQYRSAIAWQNSGYNQPPHPSFFLGAGMETPPQPSIFFAGDLPGDYNDDGTVGAADYTVWRDNLNSTAVLPNDTTPGTVTEADYAVWKGNFGATAPAGGQAATASFVAEGSDVAASEPIALVLQSDDAASTSISSLPSEIGAGAPNVWFGPQVDRSATPNRPLVAASLSTRPISITDAAHESLLLTRLQTTGLADDRTETSAESSFAVRDDTQATDERDNALEFAFAELGPGLAT